MKRIAKKENQPIRHIMGSAHFSSFGLAVQLEGLLLPLVGAYGQDSAGIEFSSVHLH